MRHRRNVADGLHIDARGSKGADCRLAARTRTGDPNLHGAHAVIAGRTYLLPDDVKAVAASVLAHRLVTDAGPVGAFDAGVALVQAILERVPSPRP